MRFAVVGAPAYFTNRKRPHVPQDLHEQVCIGRRYSSGGLYTWAFARGEAMTEVDDRALIVAAALDGIGLAHIHEALVADHVAQGSLVRVLEDWCPVLPNFFLY